MRIMLMVIKLALQLVLLAIEAVCWVGYLLRQLVLITYDMVRGVSSLHGGAIVCGEGHETPIRGDGIGYDFECSSCGWRWSGKDGTHLRCPNAECERPSTPFVSCMTCGRSVRNPLRWGRP